MDRIIEKKKWTTKKIITGGSIIGILILIIGSYYFTSGKSKLNVNIERITISEVKNGTFKEFIPVNGIVLPLTTIYLDAIEGGRVEEKFVEDGAMMKKDDPILKLANTDLELSLSNQETAVFNLLTQMQISRNAAQQNTIMKLNQGTDVESSFNEAERVYLLNKKLYDQQAISLQEFKQSEHNYNYCLKKKNLTEKILMQDSVTTNQELNQAKESYLRTQQSLKIMRKKVEDLIVKAPIDGQLTSLDAEIGQNKNKGERLGQIDVVSGFKVRVDIDEHYILHQLTDEEIISIVKLTDRESFLQKIQTGVRNHGIRESAERKLPTDELGKIPTKKTETMSHSISYVVKEGDSFWKIAHNHKVSVDAIKKANQLHSDLLKPGQKITIPRN